MITKPLMRSTPEAEGLSSRAVEALLKNFCEMGRRGALLHGYVLLRHGKVISEGHWAPCSPAMPHQLFSLSKSFTSSAIGIAQGEGLLTIDDKLVDFFPEYLSDKVTVRMRRVTLRNLLTMASGHGVCAVSRYGVDNPGTQWVRNFLEDELPYEPGTKFIYNSGATFMLSAVLQKVTGARLSDYLRPRLFDPLGFGAIQWEQNPDGIDIGGWGLWLTTEEIAAFAQLWLRSGVWNGRQLIPSDYVAMASRKQIENATIPWGGPPDWNQGYGFQFWMCRYNCFRGDGYAGQIALMMPEHDIALGITAGSNDIQAELDAAFTALMPAVRHRALAEDPAALASLRAAEASLAIPLGASGGVTVAFSAERFKMDDNKLRLSDVSVSPDLSGNAVVVRLGYYNRTAEFRAGFEKEVVTKTAFVYAEPLEVAAKAVWNSGKELVVTVLPLGTPSLFTLRFVFEGSKLTLRHSTPIWFHYGPLDETIGGNRI